MDITVNEKISKETLIELKIKATEAITLLGHANYQLLQTRRDEIVPILSKEFRQLKNDVPAESELLFGDELTKRLTAISKTAKIHLKSSTVTSSSSRLWYRDQ